MSRFFKSAAFPILIVVVLAFFAQRLINTGNQTKPPTYSEFLTQLGDGQVKSVDIKTKDNTLVVTQRDGKTYETGYTDGGADRLDAQLQAAQQQNKIDSWNVEGRKTNGWISLLTYVLPFLIFIGFWIFLMNQVQGGGSKVMSFGKSRAKRMSVDSPKITFRDVAGADEAVEELHEIKEFLENPKKFQALGARIPKGVLLFGPPGTGKTLLARAVAGEAGVPFFSASASEFVEMIVGVGASRVRDLFAQAKAAQPAIVFIDELDAIGRARGGGASLGGHDEREQTLNQILTEMDGFSPNSGVIVLAATNRPDVLDKALLRPGRFDRRVSVQPPDRQGRLEILQVHTRSVPLAPEVDLGSIASTTPGMVGADLANLVNEAALLAARRSHKTVAMADFTDAVEKIVLGVERRVMMTQEDRLRTAYHESGHALVGMLTPGADPVRKVSIIPRGMALGVTFSSPDADRFNYDEAYLKGRLQVALGGRVAEEIVYDSITSGAESDLQQVTAIARQMVGRWGMSPAIGPVAVLPSDDNGPLLPGVSQNSELTQQTVDAEVRRLADEAHAAARELLTRERDRLDALAHALLEAETLDEEAAYAAAEVPHIPVDTRTLAASTPDAAVGSEAPVTKDET